MVFSHGRHSPAIGRPSNELSGRALDTTLNKEIHMRRTFRNSMLATVALALVGGLALAHAAAAQPGPFGPDGHGRRGPGMKGEGRQGGMMLRGLDLTDAQRTQVRSVFEQHEAEIRALTEKVRTAHRAQHDAAAAVPFDEAQVRARAEEAAAAQTELAVLRARIHGEVFQLLTPEQRAKAQQLRADREKRMQERGERRQRNRPQAQPPQ
jgi:Spy/CpxP family protein refolding chaperone